MASSSDSVDSYDGDDAQRFCHKWNVAVDRYSEATRCNGQLEFAVNASQAASQANVAQAQLAESDARVTGKIFNMLISFDAPILLIF